MNRGHAALTVWGLEQVAVQRRATILDVGCGGGVTVARLAAMASEGITYGIDYSTESVAASRKENRERITLGQVEIVLGSVSHLPFPDQMFDLVTAVETHYFWPDLITDAREILRVLKPDGTFALIAEAYKGGKYDERLSKLDKLRGELKFAHLSIAEHRDMFSKAGYSDIQIIEDYERGWVCASGQKGERDLLLRQLKRTLTGQTTIPSDKNLPLNKTGLGHAASRMSRFPRARKAASIRSILVACLRSVRRLTSCLLVPIRRASSMGRTF